MSSKLFRRSLIALGLTSAINIPLAHATERSWSYTYNAQGLIETADGPRTDVSDVTRYEYDHRNRLTRIINALGHTIRIEDFDGYGNPQKITDANGVISLFSYTSQGWLASSTTAGSTTSIEYNAVGDITKLTRGDASWLEYTWDDARRLASIANNAGESISSDLNPMGKPTARRLHDNSGRVTHKREWVYDEIGRILEVIGAAGQTRKFKYDLNDNPIENNDPSDNKTQAAFDPLNRLVKNVDPLDGLSRYDYDAQDNVIKVVDPRGVITRYEYDAHGSLTHLDSPDSGKHTFLRDAAGNVTQKTDGLGITTTFTYDALNRLVHRQHPDKPELNIRFIYDENSDRRNGVGRLTSIDDSNGTMSFSYDEKGKLKDQTQTLKIGDIQYSDPIRFGYSPGDQVVRIDYPAQITIEYKRNSTGQVNAIRWRPQGSEPLDLATNLSYLPFGPLASLDWASGHKLRREYNQDYQLTQQTVADWTTANEFDASGNLVSQQSSLLGKLAYKYDPLNRLSVETTASQQQTFTYDAAGNRITKTVSLKNAEHGNPELITKYEYGVEDHKLKKIDDQNIHTDSAGNLTKLTGVSFDYDEQNRLVSAKSGVSSKASFRYNALGQRTHKITDSDTTTFIYGPKGELIGENKFDTSGIKVKSQYYIWLDGAPLAGILVSYDEQGAITNRTPFFIYSDHLNTPRIATNSNGQVIWQWASDAFGVGKAEGSLALNLRFPGQYYDEETGLHYNYFRDYSPETGRYIQSDPIGLRGGLNSYGYVNGNPINAIDPKGLEATVIYVEGLIPHAALHIDDGSGQPFLYDPAGSYVGPSNLPRGSGDFFEGPDAALDSYINYWSSEGDNVHTFPLGTTREQDKILIDRAVDRASAAPFTCASSVSAILDNMCGVAPSSWPRTLGENASQSNCK